MSIVELLLCILLFIFVGICIITDCRHSIVPNKIVVCAFFSFLILDIICYLFFARQFFIDFLINLALIAVVSLILYAYHIWAAGDCKLMLACALGIPGRLYTVWPIGKASGFVIFIIIFSTAFVFLVFESIVLRIKNKQFKIAFHRINLLRMLVAYFTTVFALLCIDGLLRVLFQEINQDQILSIAINFIIVLTLIHIRDKMSTTKLVYLLICTSITYFVLSSTGIILMSFSISVKSFILVFALMFLRIFAEEYNYRTIPVEDLKPGQILSTATVLQFAQSRITGLPKNTTEDLRSRLTQEEVYSIQKWSKSKMGSQYLIIVRKIPFVIFMGIGLFMFVITGVLQIYDYL